MRVTNPAYLFLLDLATSASYEAMETGDLTIIFVRTGHEEKETSVNNARTGLNLEPTLTHGRSSFLSLIST
jgi:hypothetical protein